MNPAPPADKRTAAIGWAELLQFFAVEPDPEARARAARLLGLPVLPPGFFDSPLQKVGGSGEKNDRREQIVQTSWQSLQAPAFWMAEQVTEPAEPEKASPKTATIHWSSDDAHEVESWLLPSAIGAPVAPVLWGSSDPIYRRLKASLRNLGAGVELDTERLMRRMSAAQWPWPLPVRRAGQVRGRLVILLDWSEPLRVFEDDVAAMALECERRFRDVVVETDVWIGGPDGHLGSTEQSLDEVDWGPDVLLVLVSDAGDERAVQRRAQRHWLQRISRRVGGLLVLSPYQPKLGKLDSSKTLEQLLTLLAALSPAITVEPGLVRSMRQALFPESSALLESLIWGHTDLVGGLPARKWRREASKKHLESLRQLRPSLRAWAAQVVMEQHANHRKVQRDEEIARLSAVWDATVTEAAGIEQRPIPDFVSALEGVGRVAQHLSHLSKGAANGATNSRLQASAAAQSRLGRFPGSLLIQQPDWVQWLTDAASQNGQGAILPDGIEQSWGSAETGATITFFSLYQQGSRLVLYKEVSDWAAYFGLGQAAPDMTASLAFEKSSKVRLLSFKVAGDRLSIHAGDQAVVRMVEDFNRPHTITSRLDSGNWSGLSPQSVRIAWPGGHVNAKWVKRPFGVIGWRQDDEGVFATLPVLAGETLEVPLKPDRTSDPVEFQPLIEGHPIGRIGAVRAGVGIDDFGVYCKAEVWGANADQMTVVRLRYIPPGRFLMGSAGGVGQSNEHPQHPVTLTEGFWMAETPCNQALWLAVMGQNPSFFESGADGPQHPVENVSFEDVTAFLKQLKVLLPESVEPALPTEAQWEYACRTGTQSAYWWGEGGNDTQANWNEQRRGTTPVDRYPPNPWGLYDMHGNVWEWCADDQRGYTGEPETNPMGSLDTETRVVRGGSWFDRPDSARSAYRFRLHYGARYRYQGFRLVLRSSSPSSEGPA